MAANRISIGCIRQIPFTQHPNPDASEEELDLLPEENNPNSDDDYDTDLEKDFSSVPEDITQGRGAYLKACENLNIVPCSPFLRQLHKSDMNIKHYNLGPKGAEAIAVAEVQFCSYEL